MKQRLYFDCNSRLHRPTRHRPGQPYTAEQLLDTMDYFRIHAGLVRSYFSENYSYEKGSRVTLADCADSPRLYPAALVPATARFELDQGDRFYPELLDQGHLTLMLDEGFFPGSLDPFAARPVAELLQERGRPLLIGCDDFNSDRIRRLAKAYPDLPMLLLRVHWNYNRQLFPLLEECPNLYLETSMAQGNDTFEMFSRLGLTNRLVFGTSYPLMSPGAAKAAVEYADISEGEKDAVAHGNACRLFGIDPASLIPYETPCRLDVIAQAADQGQPMPCLTLDSHAHMSPEAATLVPMPHADCDSMVSAMDRMGVSTSLVSNWSGITGEGYTANLATGEAMDKHSGRFLGYVTVNPNYQEEVEGLLDWYKDPRFIGLKPYEWHNGYSYLGEKYEKWFQYGNDRHLLLLLHSGDTGVAQAADRLAEKYPDLQIIMAHSGMSFQAADLNLAVAKRHQNVFLEITFTSVTYGVIEYMVSQIGADRILYGTDFPMRSAPPQLGWLAYTHLSVAEKELILGKNLQRLLNNIR